MAGFGLKVKISAYAMPMLVFGVILIFQKAKALKGIGYVLAGLGFLFLGIHYMKEGFEAFKDSIDLTAYAVSGLSRPVAVHADRHRRDGGHAVQPRHAGADHHRAGGTADHLRERAGAGDRRQRRHHHHRHPRRRSAPTSMAGGWRRPT